MRPRWQHLPTTATILTGTAVPYMQRAVIGGLFEEQFLPGALDSTTIAPGAIPTPLLLWQRSDDWPVGKSIDWQSQPGGLTGVWRLNDTADAVRAGNMARRRDLACMSIGFQPGISRWEFRANSGFDPTAGKYDLCHRVTARLCETSLVNACSYIGSHVHSVTTTAEQQRSQRSRPVDLAPRSAIAWRLEVDRMHRQHRPQQNTKTLARTSVAEYRNWLASAAIGNTCTVAVTGWSESVQHKQGRLDLIPRHIGAAPRGRGRMTSSVGGSFVRGRVASHPVHIAFFLPNRPGLA